MFSAHNQRTTRPELLSTYSLSLRRDPLTLSRVTHSAVVAPPCPAADPMFDVFAAVVDPVLPNVTSAPDPVCRVEPNSRVLLLSPPAHNHAALDPEPNALEPIVTRSSARFYVVDPMPGVHFKAKDVALCFQSS